MRVYLIARPPAAGRTANARPQPATLFQVVMTANQGLKKTIELKDVKLTIE